jgi:DNA-binding FrmR family transcriptional regulator
MGMQYSTRIKKIIGQLEALDKMTQRSNACDKVLQQISAIQGATTSLKRQFVEDSLEQCKTADDTQKEVKKLITTIRRYI